MTMHLLGPAYTTTQTKTRKSKLTTTKYTKYAMDWAEYNKQMKRLGSKTKTLEEYVAYREGRYKPKLRGVKAVKYTPDNHRQLYPSQNEMGVTFAKKPNTYTGDKLVGIAMMHKSNLVPVFSQEDAEDISRMRR